MRKMHLISSYYTGYDDEKIELADNILAEDADLFEVIDLLIDYWVEDEPDEELRELIKEELWGNAYDWRAKPL